MHAKRNYGGLDAFRLAAAFLVIAIHTSPLTCFGTEADFFLTRVLARVAVPFFFMVTGQFTVSRFYQSGDARPVLVKSLKRLSLLYGVAIVLYFPIGLYGGHYQALTLGGALRLLLFDGTFYHLWYFPVSRRVPTLFLYAKRIVFCACLSCPGRFAVPRNHDACCQSF